MLQRVISNFVVEIFDFVKRLGSGAFGEVHLVIDKKTKEKRALKVINKNQVALPVEQINVSVCVWGIWLRGLCY